MGTIESLSFGRTGHLSTRTIFGSVCFWDASQTEADQVFELLLKYGINHIDTAPAYRNAERRLGPWMKHHRDRFFLATKVDVRTYEDAREQFHRSLETLQVDSVDLLQLHNLTDIVDREVIMGPGGALEYLIEAKEKGLTRFLGITGHGILAPRMHRESLNRFDFDSVLLPCNYLLMQNPTYADEFNQLVDYCHAHNIAVQTIKAIARGYWGSKERSHVTWYEPLTDEAAIAQLVHWVLGYPGVFLNTVGDMQELPKVLAAAANYQPAPSDQEMQALVEKHSLVPLFN